MFFYTTSQILFCKKPIDMRKAIDGLSILIADEFQKNPTDSFIFLFRNKGRDKLKLLYWDRNGFCLWYKRLEKGRFYFPNEKEGVMELSSAQLRWLCDGLDFMKLKGHPTLSYKTFY